MLTTKDTKSTKGKIFFRTFVPPSKIGSSCYECLIGCHSEAQPKNLLCLSIGKADASLSLSMTSRGLVAILFPFSAGVRKIMKHFMVKILPRASYLNSGMTFSANKRMFFIANSCGMPPK